MIKGSNRDVSELSSISCRVHYNDFRTNTLRKGMYLLLTSPALSSKKPWLINRCLNTNSIHLKLYKNKILSVILTDRFACPSVHTFLSFFLKNGVDIYPLFSCLGWLFPVSSNVCFNSIRLTFVRSYANITPYINPLS